jgi:hypothetical protein
MAQAVSHRSLSEKARVHEWVSLSWVCGGQSDTEKGFCPIVPCLYNFTVAVYRTSPADKQ